MTTVDPGVAAVGTAERAASWVSLSSRFGDGRRKHAHSAGRPRASAARGVEDTRIFAGCYSKLCCVAIRVMVRRAVGVRVE